MHEGAANPNVAYSPVELLLFRKERGEFIPV